MGTIALGAIGVDGRREPAEARGIMADLGMRPGDWAELRSAVPIDSSTSGTLLRLDQEAEGVLLPTPASLLRKWDGHAFELFGRLIDRAPERDETPWWRVETDEQTYTLKVWR